MPKKPGAALGVTVALTPTNQLKTKKTTPPRPQAPQVQVDDNDETQEETIEAVIRRQTINMFKSVLLFSQGAADYNWLKRLLFSLLSIVV